MGVDPRPRPRLPYDRLKKLGPFRLGAVSPEPNGILPVTGNGRWP